MISNESTRRTKLLNPASRQSRASHLPKPLSLSVGARNNCKTGPASSFVVAQNISCPSKFSEVKVPAARLNVAEKFVPAIFTKSPF